LALWRHKTVAKKRFKALRHNNVMITVVVIVFLLVVVVAWDVEATHKDDR
jgi:hypothetical protein